MEAVREKPRARTRKKDAEKTKQSKATENQMSEETKLPPQIETKKATNELMENATTSKNIANKSDEIKLQVEPDEEAQEAKEDLQATNIPTESEQSRDENIAPSTEVDEIAKVAMEEEKTESEGEKRQQIAEIATSASFEPIEYPMLPKPETVILVEEESKRAATVNIYPTLGGLTREIRFIEMSDFTATIETAPAARELLDLMDYRKEEQEEKEKAPLSVYQLLEYYKNDEILAAQHFVENFIETDLNPRNSLYALLLSLKQLTEQYHQNDQQIKDTVGQITVTNNTVWTPYEKKQTHHSKCGCGRHATADVTQKVAHFHAEKLVELKGQLNALSRCELEVGYSTEVRVRTLLLLVQWKVLQIAGSFCAEHQVAKDSGPLLLNLALTPSRAALRGALSDLFYFLRFPALVQRFRDHLTAWITELGAILLKACTAEDQYFLLAHCLRCPSPIADWGPSLIQTFIDVPTLDPETPLNLFSALFGILVAPIKAREKFLHAFIDFYGGGAAGSSGGAGADADGWHIVGDDGEEVADLVDLTEVDLIVLLSQFNFERLISVALKHFSAKNFGNAFRVALSLVSLLRMVLQIADQGLLQYAAHKSFCKKVAGNIRTMLQLFCEFWAVAKGELYADDRSLVQREVDAIVFTAFSSIVNKKIDGIRQYAIGFTWNEVSRGCLLRCELAIRNPEKYAKNTLFIDGDDDEKISDNEKELSTKIGAEPSIVDQFSGAKGGADEVSHSLSILAALISRSKHNLQSFIKEIIDLCFLNETGRDQCYKFGAEVVSVLIESDPALLSPILHIVDRNIDHLDSYARSIFTNVDVGRCRLSMNDLALLGKWLVNRPMEHPSSHIARHILCFVNWGYYRPEESDSSDSPSSSSPAVNNEIQQQLWIPQAVHDACADAVVKAHIVNCKQRNGLIWKSMTKAARLATRCPDHENQFERFCWDVLGRLKIQPKPHAPAPVNDLTAFFQFIFQKSLKSPSEFLENGLKYFVEIVNSGAFNAAAILLVEIVRRFATNFPAMLTNQTFSDAIWRLLHGDESSYVVQLFVGADKFPGPILSILASALTTQMFVVVNNNDNSTLTSATMEIGQKRVASMDAWLSLLTRCAPTGTAWNEDKHCVYLLDVLVRCAFSSDPVGMLGIQSRISELAKEHYKKWKNAPKGLMSWFSAASVHPPVISSSVFQGIAPWAVFVFLKEDPNMVPAFYRQLFESMGKHPQLGTDEVVRKAAGKTGIPMAVERLPFFEWLQFSVFLASEKDGASEGGASSPLNLTTLFPLALQQLAVVMLSRKQYSGKSYCPGARFLKSPQSKQLFEELREQVLPCVEKLELGPVSGFCADLLHWLFDERFYSTGDGLKPVSVEQFFVNGHLLELILSPRGDGNNEIAEQHWVGLVDTDRLGADLEKRAKLFVDICQLNSPLLNSSSSSAKTKHAAKNLAEFLSSLDNGNGFITHSPTRGHRPFPMAKITGTPIPCEPIDLHTGMFSTECPTAAKFSVSLGELIKSTRYFLGTLKSVAVVDGKYLEQFQSLYTTSKKAVATQFRCSGRCSSPAVHSVSVEVNNYDQQCADRMNANRATRAEEVTRLLHTTDALALNCAQLEHISSALSALWVSSSGKNEMPRTVGLKLFYKLYASLTQVQDATEGGSAFKAAIDCCQSCFNSLGQAFVAENAREQAPLMQAILHGASPMAPMLVDFFTPHCLAPGELFAVYAQLSSAVRGAETRAPGLALLRRLDIAYAGRQLPPNQFSALLPLIYENLVSIPNDPGEQPELMASLRAVCQEHFVHTAFHHFPFNFAEALRLLLSSFDRRATSPTVLEAILQTLGVQRVFADTDVPGGIRWASKQTSALCGEFSSELITTLLGVIATQLAASRASLKTQLFEVWVTYLNPLCELIDFLLRIRVCLEFNPEKGERIIEHEMCASFDAAVAVFSALLEPVSNQHLPPWTVADRQSAELVLGRFLRHLAWCPHSAHLLGASGPPTTTTNVQSLFWRYLSTKLLPTSWLRNKQLQHIFDCYERKVTLLNWNQFWPSIEDVEAMAALLADSDGQSPMVAPTIVEILVRIDWIHLAKSRNNDDDEQSILAHRDFVALLLSVLARCVHRSETFASRASLANVVVSLFADPTSSALSGCWPLASVAVVDQISAFIVAHYPPEAVLGVSGGASASPTGGTRDGGGGANPVVLNAFLQGIWQKACCFHQQPMLTQTVSNSTTVSEYDVAKKRALFTRTQLRTLVSPRLSSLSAEERLQFYTKHITRCNHFVATTTDKCLCLDIVRELIAFWPDSECPTPDQFLGAFLEWLGYGSAFNVDSLLLPLVLRVSAEALGAENVDQLVLPLLDACVQLFFKRRQKVDGEAEHIHELLHWLNIPEWVRARLFAAPVSSSKKEKSKNVASVVVKSKNGDELGEGGPPWFALLNAHLVGAMLQLRSVEEELALLKRVADFLKALKAKHVKSPSHSLQFLLCVAKWQKLCLRQFTANASTGIIPLPQAIGRLDEYHLFLQQLHAPPADNSKSVSLLSSIVAKFTPKVKPRTFPTVVQFVSTVLYLYLAQQQLANTGSPGSGGRSDPVPPRLSGETPVLSSRSGAFSELLRAHTPPATVKKTGGGGRQSPAPGEQQQHPELGISASDWERLCAEIGAYFKRPEEHHLGHADALFQRLLQLLFPGEPPALVNST